MAGDPGFLQALDDLKALHLSKGHDYADTSDPLKNYVQSARDGGVAPWRAAFLRLCEKYHRIVNLLAKDEAPNHESIDDTFMDLAAMSLIVRSLRNRSDKSADKDRALPMLSHMAASLSRDRDADKQAAIPDSGIKNAPTSGTIAPNSGAATFLSSCPSAFTTTAQGDGDDGA